jgi:hypothetical protein
MENAQKKMLEQNGRKHFVQVGPNWKEMRRRTTKRSFHA